MSKSSNKPPTQDTVHSASETPGEEFLKTEYETLNEWARHGEEAVNKIFNFYVSILTASVGGLIVLPQFVSRDLTLSLLLVSGICLFLIIVGAVFFDATITQYVRNVHYYIGILAIQSYFKRYAIVAGTLRSRPPVSIEADAENPERYIAVRIPRLKNILPVGTQQIFISVVNSLLVGATILCWAWGLGGIGFRFIETLIAIVVSGFGSFFIHNLFARRSMQRYLDEAKHSYQESLGKR